MLTLMAVSLAIFGAGFASGYYVRDRISKRRQLEAKRRIGWI